MALRLALKLALIIISTKYSAKLIPARASIAIGLKDTAPAGTRLRAGLDDGLLLIIHIEDYRVHYTRASRRAAAAISPMLFRRRVEDEPISI